LAGGLDAFDGAVDEAPVPRAAGCLEVIDLNGCAGPPADLQRLVDRRVQAVALRPDVGDVEAATSTISSVPAYASGG
jgi:hypothetical protein